MNEREANWINLMGLDSALQRVIEGWPGLVDTDELSEVGPPRLLPLGSGLRAQAEAGEDVWRVGLVEHAPGKGEVLLARLQREIPSQLGLSGTDVLILTGFYLEPAEGDTTS